MDVASQRIAMRKRKFKIITDDLVHCGSREKTMTKLGVA
jgi:hypothetical protein